ncbi:hypothetical protein [Clostridium sp. JS66]|uniref:hypothetical protein n=1 Tax=Clostridium sp. JS66 TaxID=3064705 RepID=UPI00298DE790|nr:hypothetical protein [Clostridium sp. JS66]WPC41051.1 hypothetical protein Q6H37_24645 [Clostridium sp. JS66]
MPQYIQSNLIEYIDELVKYFKKIIYCCEINENNLIEDIFESYLIPRFSEFRKGMGNSFFNITSIKKVVMDIECLLANIEELMDLQRCKIVAIVSNDNKFQGKYVNDIPVFGQDEIHYVNYDYMIVSNCSMFAQDEKRVININDYLKDYYHYEVFRAYANYFNCKKPFEGFITGLSYAEVGIDAAQLPYNVANVAVSSQDLFYDYQWAKMILNNDEIVDDIKFAIIGLGYYSFEYDLSKSNFKNLIYNYYPFFGITRNHPCSKEMVDNYDKFEQMASQIFKKDYNIILHNFLDKQNKSWWNNMINGILDDEKAEQYKWVVEKDCNKDYPETVKENTKILQDYISLLKSKKITPIIVACPTSSYYYEKFSPRIKEEFEKIINKIKEEFDVEILDYFDSKIFLKEDFYDVSHLNKNGTMKFTKLLKDKLEKLI